MAAAALVRRLAEVLGVAPQPLSERAVWRLLQRWLELEAWARTGCHVPTEAPWREPGWLLLRATIAAKVARCPAALEYGTRMPAVELAVRASAELDVMVHEWRHALMAGLRQRRPRLRGEIAEAVARLRRAETEVARLRQTAAYRRGIEYLGREFAWCIRLDPFFRAWAAADRAAP